MGKKTIVLKLGTSSIVDETTQFPRLSALSLLVETAHSLRLQGIRVVLVSSGAIGIGYKRLNLDKRPKHLAQVQAVAAVGQGRLMALYDELFGNYNIPIAQVLLSRENLAEKVQYMNACNTFKELLNMDVVPIVNENDAVSNSEIRFGDNDSLSAIAAGMVNADFLFLMTDVDALYTDNPRKNPDAKPLRVVQDIPSLKDSISVKSPGSSLGTGGMVTKLIAAELATSTGCTTVITHGAHPERIMDLITQYENYKTSQDLSSIKFGTYFVARDQKLVDRKLWLKQLYPHGILYIDGGAVESIIIYHKSLFSAGVFKVEGQFQAQQCVSIRAFIQTEDKIEDVEIARGLVNYSAVEISQLMGLKSRDIQEKLGYVDTEWIIHRDNLVVMNGHVLDLNGIGSRVRKM